MLVVRKEFKKFGTQIDLQLLVEDQAQVFRSEQDLEIAVAKCEEIEKIFSRFDQESELMQVNANLNKFVKASPLFLEVAQLTLKYFEETQGYFDPRILSKLQQSGYHGDFEKIRQSTALLTDEEAKVDFSNELKDDLLIADGQVLFKQKMDFTGLVKGFAVDHLSKFFLDQGWHNFVVDCGGDMFFGGKYKNGKAWYIDIEGISHQALMLKLENQGIATSGIGKRKWEIEGKRFHHLINPKKIGEYAFDLKAVTVVATQAQQADVWAKTLFVVGVEQAKDLANAKKIPCVILNYQGGAWVSEELKQYLYNRNEQKK